MEGMRNVYKILVGKPSAKDNLGNTGVNGMIILKRIAKM
jgi:hypothetical protein